MAVCADKKIDWNKFPTLERSFELDRANFDKDKRTVRVQFASETPVKRWFGNEVLDCSAACVDMARVNAGAAVLMEHDPKMRCGITEGGTLTASRTAEALIRFSRNAAGDACMAEVEDGTLRWVSVGYRVEKMETDDSEEDYRATRWTPLEISFVGIPADPTARVLRNQNAENKVMITRSIRLDKDAPDTGGGAPDLLDEAEPKDERGEAITLSKDQVRDVFALANRFETRYPGCVEKADEFIRAGDNAELKLRQHIMVLQQQDTRVNGNRIIEGPNAGLRSYGELFVQNEKYRKFGNKDQVGNKRAISIELADRLQFRTTFSASTESLTAIQKLPGVPGILDQQQLMVADLFSQGQTDALTVRYIIEDAFTNAATAVAEGAVKPEATLNVSEVDATVRKIAVWTKVTEEMIADFPAMSSYINSRLAYMVQAKEDNHLLNGTGNTNQIKGVLLFSGLQTVSGATNPLDGIMKAISYVRGANGAGFGEPTAIIMNPLDWMNAKLTKDANLQYYGGGPFSGIYGAGMYSNVYNMWGLPCVVTTAMSQGTALVGDFKTAAQIFRRRGLAIEATNSDNDDFQRNLMTIRAEERLTLCVYQPTKFCTVTGIPAVA